MHKKILLLCIWFVTVINFTSGLQSDFYTQIPDEPAFPVISLRIKMVGQDFLGIISDIESDILTNPSLLSLFKYNEVNVSFLPYIKNKIGYPVSLCFFYPKLLTSKVGFGFQNQYVYSSKETNYVINDMNINQFYNFWTYQQLFFLSFSTTPNLNLSPFYSITRSSYRNENEYNFPLEAADSFDYSHYSISRLNNNYNSQQFGLGMNYHWERNSLHFVASLQKGNNKNNRDGQDSTWSLISYLYNNTFNNSYYHYLDKSTTLYKQMATTQGTKQNDVLRLNCRWYKELKNNDKINSLVDIIHSSEDQFSTCLDSEIIIYTDSIYRRWRNYPYPESTRITIDSTKDCYKYNTNSSGKYTATKLSVGFGYESPISKFTQGFVGIKSVFIYESESTRKERLEVTSTNSTSDTTITFYYNAIKNKRLVVSIPVAWEYTRLHPFIIRWGITSKISFENTRTKYDFDSLYYNTNSDNLDFDYSFGIGVKITPKLYVDAYNTGNFFKVKEGGFQIKYIF